MEAKREDVVEVLQDRAFVIALFLFGVLLGGLVSAGLAWFLVGPSVLLCFIGFGGMVIGGMIGGPIAALLQFLTGSFDRPEPDKVSDKYFEL